MWRVHCVGPTECEGCAHYYSATVALAVFSCIIFVVIVILLVLLLREPASKRSYCHCLLVRVSTVVYLKRKPFRAY